MKYLITILTAGIILGGCGKKNEESKPPTGDTSQVISDSLQNAVKNINKNQVSTPKGALDALVNMPQGANPLPPHLLPVKDISFLEKTDNTASFAVTSGSTGAKAKVTMKQRITGSDTIWILSKIEDIK